MPTSTCKWPECLSAAATRGFCPTHYYRARKVGDFESPWAGWIDGRTSDAVPCRWPSCATESWGRGYCRKHYQRARNLGDFEAPWESWQARQCAACGDPFTGRNRAQRCCSDKCNVIIWQQENADRYRELGRRHSAKRRALVLGTATEDFSEDDVRARTGDCCYLCGLDIDFTLRWPDMRSPSLDHVVPLSKGGTHTLDNVAMTHLKCNLSKNARLITNAPIVGHLKIKETHNGDIHRS